MLSHGLACISGRSLCYFGALWDKRFLSSLNQIIKTFWWLLFKVALVKAFQPFRNGPPRKNASLSWQSHHLNSLEGRCRLAIAGLSSQARFKSCISDLWKPCKPSALESSPPKNERAKNQCCFWRIKLLLHQERTSRYEENGFDDIKLTHIKYWLLTKGRQQQIVCVSYNYS